MRWYHHNPESGDTRVKSGFLFLPKCIEMETRWLETTCWMQQYLPATYAHDGGWVDFKWGEIG